MSCVCTRYLLGISSIALESFQTYGWAGRVIFIGMDPGGTCLGRAVKDGCY